MTMRRIMICTHARKLALGGILGSLVCLAGCGEGGPGSEAMAPPKSTEGLAKTNDAVEKVTATGDEYNNMMRKQQEERLKKGSDYSKK